MENPFKISGLRLVDCFMSLQTLILPDELIVQTSRQTHYYLVQTEPNQNSVWFDFLTTGWEAQ